MFTDLIESKIKESVETKRDLVTRKDSIKSITRAILGVFQDDGKVILFGNGGSAADAQHLAAEFAGKYQLERESLAALALTTNTSSLTAISNDYDFEEVFSRQIEGIAKEEDLAIGISTSGNSQNVINGLLKANKLGAVTVGFTGKTGGKLAEIVDYSLQIPSEKTPRIQEAHILAGHIICGIVEEELFGTK